MRFNDIEKIRSMDDNTKNVFRITAPYYTMNPDDTEERRKVIFFGCDFRNLPPGTNFEEFIKVTNNCLDFIRRECSGMELYYRPHPVEVDEYKSLNLSNFKIETEKTIGEWFLYKNLSQIKYVFSHFSSVSMSAFGFGLNSYVFFPLFEGALLKANWEGYFNF